MNQYQHRKSGFTLLELVIVIAVVLILATVAVSQSSSTLDFLRFNKTFNKVIFMIQKTRDLAITAGKSDVLGYFTKFSMLSANTPQVEIFAKKTSTNELIENFSSSGFPANISLQIKSGVSDCQLPVEIFFENTTADLNLTCLGLQDPASAAVLKITLKDASRQKSFVIHKASGIPQVE